MGKDVIKWWSPYASGVLAEPATAIWFARDTAGHFIICRSVAMFCIA